MHERYRQMTDRRQTTDGRAIAYSEREREFTFVKNGISIDSAVFAQMTAEYPYTLQWDAPFPSKLPLPKGDLDPI